MNALYRPDYLTSIAAVRLVLALMQEGDELAEEMAVLSLSEMKNPIQGFYALAGLVIALHPLGDEEAGVPEPVDAMRAYLADLMIWSAEDAS